MHDFGDFRQRREELFREAASERLARAIRSSRKTRRLRIPAPGWELRRYGGRLSKVFRALRNEI